MVEFRWIRIPFLPLKAEIIVSAGSSAASEIDQSCDCFVQTYGTRSSNIPNYRICMHLSWLFICFSKYIPIRWKSYVIISLPTSSSLNYIHSQIDFLVVCNGIQPCIHSHVAEHLQVFMAEPQDVSHWALQWAPHFLPPSCSSCGRSMGQVALLIKNLNNKNIKNVKQLCTTGVNKGG